MFIKRKKSEVENYLEEMFDRVWFVRNVNQDLSNTPEKIRIASEKAVREIMQKYNLKEEEISDWDYGYWSGILAALRWMLGDEKDFLDT